MKQLIKTLAAAAALTAGTVIQASAACLITWPVNALCDNSDTGSSGGGGTTVAAPEIDVTQGFAAIAILIVAALILRERFLRQRTKA
jgi:hypothetical protein